MKFEHGRLGFFPTACLLILASAVLGSTLDGPDSHPVGLNSQGRQPASISQRAPSSVLIENLTWVEAEKALKSYDVVLIALGARSKEHGPHLPLDTDFIMAEYLRDQVIKQVSVAVLPTIEYGYYPAFLEYPGSISIGRETFKNCDNPVNVELMIALNHEFAADYGKEFREVSKQEAKDIIKDCHEKGLLHTIIKCRQDFYALCNCCRCCCVPLRLSKDYGIGKALTRDKTIVKQFRESLEGCKTAGK